MRILVDEFIGSNRITVSHNGESYEIIVPAFNFFTEEGMNELVDLLKWSIQLAKLPLDSED